jgi:hypothetical protein
MMVFSVSELSFEKIGSKSNEYILIGYPPYYSSGSFNSAVEGKQQKVIRFER